MTHMLVAATQPRQSPDSLPLYLRRGLVVQPTMTPLFCGERDAACIRAALIELGYHDARTLKAGTAAIGQWLRRFPRMTVAQAYTMWRQEM